MTRFIDKAFDFLLDQATRVYSTGINLNKLVNASPPRVMWIECFCFPTISVISNRRKHLYFDSVLFTILFTKAEIVAILECK